VIVIVVIIAIAGLVASRRRTAAQRDNAQSLRSDADQRAPEVDQQDAKAREIAARADMAKAEADRKAAEADRLESVAGNHRARTDEARDELDSQRQEADRIDPDVENDPDDDRDTGPGGGPVTRP
jgi:FtsZ-interacting cell division protein ZipA